MSARFLISSLLLVSIILPTSCQTDMCCRVESCFITVNDDGFYEYNTGISYIDQALSGRTKHGTIDDVFSYRVIITGQDIIIIESLFFEEVLVKQTTNIRIITIYDSVEYIDKYPSNIRFPMR